MDPLTQGLLGAAAAGACLHRRLPRSGWAIGLVAAMTPDLDVFFPASGSTIAAIANHRHFTHSLLFIPIGALIAAGPFLILPVYRGLRRWVIAAALIGYATHAPLDACTSYGTLLWWPLSDRRVSWDLIAIIDPVFTLALLAGLLDGWWRRSVTPIRVGLAAAVLYLGLGGVQHHRALEGQRMLAASRGQTIQRGRAMPTLGNVLVWRSVYESGGQLYADAVRTPLLGRTQVRPGDSLPRFTGPTLALEEQAAADLAVFLWFADGYVGVLDDDPLTIGDLRYSLTAEGFAPMWGVRVTAEGVRWARFSGPRRDPLRRLWRDVTGSLGEAEATGWIGLYDTRR